MPLSQTGSYWYT
ncbi:hypothetical protein F383_31677 [Gossypium arboreum]|uniref:Uncharacterized protein n=1 Tax=Gossypium arboreum TaxID=29729 RepID=A0A0B0MYZ7_GOSAR|nr:hypothetical protein F383_31677 [Gossypium arboreum]